VQGGEGVEGVAFGHQLPGSGGGVPVRS
jgi:hypothetical protein